jgi:acyl-CoA thioesterase
VSGSRFAEQMALTPRGDGRYDVELAEIWNCPIVPHGGIATAVSARAMQLALDVPDQVLRSVSNVFAAQVPAGPVEVDVRVLRRGRSMSQATATVRSRDADAGHTAIAVFGAPRPGFEFTDLAPPDVPAPEDCPSFRDPPPEDFVGRPPFNFWEHVEGRPALGHAPWDDYVPSTSERASWLRFDEPPIADDGTLDPLALVTLCDTMPGSVSERMGPGLPMWYPPSADLTVHVLRRSTSEWVLARGHARHAGSGYASVDLELWDPAAGLVAYGTQVMFFTFPDGPPPADRVRPPGP